MNWTELSRLLKDRGFHLENIEGLEFKIGDRVEVLEKVQWSTSYFPCNLFAGIEGRVIGFDPIRGDSPEQIDPKNYPVLVLLPINNLQIYKACELRVLPPAHPTIYVGFDELIWGLIVQSLRIWADQIFQKNSEKPCAATDLAVRLVKLGKAIEQQIKERKVCSGKEN
ncbi:MAG: hypothetical protein AMJ88_13660 [Anaerolineae bacterium SM23_ 63]|nr:MAG: hypothetical protein AMJ88_13660 [Anaerolineae bacterium SM23_ 63]